MEEKNIIEIKNKRAAYEYFLMDEYTAGIVLMGSEIKSIREGKANLTDAWCTFVGNELFVRDMHISEYKFGSYWGHQAKRDRKLLLNRRELNKTLPMYSQIAKVEIMEQEFEHTPKRSIKRFLYK